jgi:hypothetical protein
MSIFWMAMLCLFTCVAGGEQNQQNEEKERAGPYQIVMPSQNDPPEVVFKWCQPPSYGPERKCCGLTRTDIGMVTICVLLEIGTAYKILRYRRVEVYQDAFISTVATFGLSAIPMLCAILKLFPGTYNCESEACSKITHNSIFTLVSVLFDLIQIADLGKIRARNQSGDSSEEVEGDVNPTGTAPRLEICAKQMSLIFKRCSLMVSFTWVMVDLVLTISSAPGVGTVVLGLVAGAASIFGVFFDLYTAYMTSNSQRAEDYIAGRHRDEWLPSRRVQPSGPSQP